MTTLVPIAEVTKRDAEIDRLRDIVAWQKSELGLVHDLGVSHALRQRYRLARAEARIVCALYSARTRILTRETILERIPPPGSAGDNDDRALRLVDVWVCKIRAKLGKDAVESVWGAGYKLGPAGVAIVDAILGPDGAREGRT